MWFREFAGYDIYHLSACFFLFSILGWLVESIYMSVCNRKLTNRGFMTGPFCPIYGVGAVVGFLILHPFAKNPVALYIIGAILATIFEYLVARLMLCLFGEVWWDYHDKPYNYQGLICLESTLAWGLYAVIIICFLFNKVMSIVDRYPVSLGKKALMLVFAVAFIDFNYHFVMAINKKLNADEKRFTIMDIYDRIRRK